MSRLCRRLWLYGTLGVAIVGFWFFPAWLPPAARDALRQPDRFELLSLGPPDYAKPLSADLFHRRVVLGSTPVTDPAVRARLVTALERGSERVYLLPLCLNPRHAIRVTHDGVATDLVICFECEQAQVWRDGKQIAAWTTNASPEPVLDAVLAEAGLPLAAKP